MPKSFELLAPLATLIGLSACDGKPSQPPQSPPPSTTSAPVPLPSLEGIEPLRAGDAPLAERLKGRVAVLDLWATWCEPCRDSIPKVVRLADAYADTDLLVAGVHVGAGVETAQRYADDAGIRYPLYADPRFVFSDRIGSRSVPLLVVVDREGTIVHRTSELDKRTLSIIADLLAR